MSIKKEIIAVAYTVTNAVINFYHQRHIFQPLARLWSRLFKNNVMIFLWLLIAYHCAFVSDILLQGFLYITDNWFCFYSKLLGKKRVRRQLQICSLLGEIGGGCL